MGISAGCQYARWLVGLGRDLECVLRSQAFTGRLNERFLSRPTGKEGAPPQGWWKASEAAGLRGREEALGYAKNLDLVSDPLDVDSDRSVGAHRDERHVVAVRNVEMERLSTDGEFGFAIRAVRENNGAGSDATPLTQDVAKRFP